MLTPEQAISIIEQHKIQQDTLVKRHLDAINQLPKKLRHTAFALIGRDKKGELVNTGYWHTPEQVEQQKKRQAALDLLEEMSNKERIQIIATFLPKIADTVEQAWHLQKQMPYQTGYVRKAFRVPHHSDNTLQKRTQWLSQLITRLSHFDEDLIWWAQYGAYVDRGHYGWAMHVIGVVFAAAINEGDALGDEVFDILVASAKGEHEIGHMGRHIPRALLTASRPDGWAFIENLLLAAQRQEGLRQTILETVDEAHPEAFQRMLRVIVENNLVRFSAVTRAVNVWFGFRQDSANTRGIKAMLSVVSDMVDSSEHRQRILANGDGEAIYLALWATAFEDAYAAISLAVDLLKDKQVERRFAALHLLATLDLSKAQAAMIPALQDEDLRLVAYTCRSWQRGHNLSALDQDDLFEQLEAVLDRLPKKARSLEPVIWPWIPIEANRAMVARLLLDCLDDRSPKRLIVHMSTLDKNDRVRAVRLLAESGMGDSEVRDVVLKLVGDRAGWVRDAAIDIMSKQKLVEEDAPYLEGLLTRKTNDLRRGVIRLLVTQPDQAVLASADRLIATSKPLQRQAGLELLQQLVDGVRAKAECRQRAEAYRQSYPEISDVEDALIRRIMDDKKVEASLDNVLGLIDPADRTAPHEPQKHELDLVTEASVGCLVALDNLVHQHRQTAIILKAWQGEQEVLLGNAYGLPAPNPEKSVEDDRENLPLSDLWLGWYDAREATLRDEDGLELIRAWIDHSNGYHTNLSDKGPKRIQLRYANVVESIVLWLIRIHEPDGAADFLLDMLEHTYATIPEQTLNLLLDKDHHGDWRHNWNSPYPRKLQIVRQFRSLGATWHKKHDVHLFRLLRWLDEPISEAHRFRPMLDEVLRAYDTGAATEADLYDQLLGSRMINYYGGGQFHDIRMLAGKKQYPLLIERPELAHILEACRQRILEIELLRGELPTAASAPAMALRAVPGIAWFVRIVSAFGKDSLARGYAYNNQSRSVVLSHLLRVTFPAEGETVESFVTAVREAKLSEKMLLKAAVYAPQWVAFVEAALGWAGFADAVWWLHAHTKDTNWYVDAEIREAWQAQVSELTPLSSEDLLAGAVDVQTFWRIYNKLGQYRMAKIQEAAKYSSGGQGHKRAMLFADAMLSQVAVEDVVKRITKKRHQDSVRALGLIPLESKDQDVQILARYQVMQEFVRTSRKYGAQRQQSEKLAARIGMENLARTAGYPDPLRLQWAMEAHEDADLREGEVSVTVEDVTMVLRIDEVGKPHLTVTRAGKKLKNIPAKMRKVEGFVELRERRKRIEQQHSRMRHALENAMCKGDIFRRAELEELTQHPVLAPLLEQIVFMTDAVIGYPVEGGSALLRFDGTVQPIPHDASLRIAHVWDLYQSKEWFAWQRECFISERIQPFKQVYRELYILTEAEKVDYAISRRYAGHQVQPRQAIALLGSRGWVARPEEGVQRTFHEHKLSAFITFLNGFYTPAEVEGLTVEGVVFMKQGHREPLPLTEVPPVIFSEVMRDMDLVVSVAHRGGVDPEATASTIEMRTALIQQTCQLLKVDNVELRGNHALIAGMLGSYSVHLGSSIVHRQPGGALCIVPVHAQHRGRLFLPFADDDPKTAEVISKVLLLAQDDQIKDPVILEQIYAGS